MSKILVIPDTHFPYQHPNFFIDLARLVRYFRPTHIVQMGDLVDYHAISRHDPDPDGPEIIQEVVAARKAIKKLAAMIPHGVDVRICIGNHDNRIDKRAAVNGIPRIFLKTFKEILMLPDSWSVAFDHYIDDWAFMHGKSNLRGKTALAYGCNVAQGHFHHMLDITYHQTPKRMICSVFCGSAADDDSIAMSYAGNNLQKSPYGFVLIENGIPRIVPGTPKNK